MNEQRRILRTFLLIFLAVNTVRSQSTPVIGGSCKLGSADVNIGGKQTQFYLHCEPEDPSRDVGVWVVKTRAKPQAAAHALPYEEPTQYQQHPKKQEKLPSNPILCEQQQAIEHGICNVPETCLQANYEEPSSYLQCNPTTRKWTKKYCQQGFWFSFEHQSCVAHASSTRTFRQHVARKSQPVQTMHAYSNNGGLVCTFSQCSPSNPCSTGTCNNGYCCSSSSPLLGVPMQISCAAGFTSTVQCSGRQMTCPPGLFCDKHIRMCCPMLLPLKEVTTTRMMITTTTAIPRPHVYHHHYPPRLLSSNIQKSSFKNEDSVHHHLSHNSLSLPSHSYKHRRTMSSFPCPRCNQFYSYACPNGASPYGRCNSGSCGAGFTCMPSTQLCCPTATALAPSLMYSSCPSGSGAGACVSGQCSPGYSCNSNNVCCAQVVPATVCPDGTQAAGACVNNMCGVGFTCNQGLCCTNSSQTPRCLDGSQAIGACMQGKCGSGYTCTTGNICCPSTLGSCPAGQTSIGTCVNGRCPEGYDCINGQCCGPANGAASTATCTENDSNGPCTSDGNCPEPGYLCDTTNNWCCPQIVGNAVGPCIVGELGARLCPEGYACQGDGVGNCFRLNTGTCAPEDQSGPCRDNSQCPANFTCYGGFCCRNGSFRRRKRSSFLADYFKN